MHGDRCRDFLGAAERNLEWVGKELHPPRSLAWFCPRCSIVWARAAVIVDKATQRWHVMTTICPFCPSDGFDVPGSLSLPWDNDYENALPNEVLRREICKVTDFLDAGGNPELV